MNVPKVEDLASVLRRLAEGAGRPASSPTPSSDQEPQSSRVDRMVAAYDELVLRFESLASSHPGIAAYVHLAAHRLHDEPNATKVVRLVQVAAAVKTARLLFPRQPLVATVAQVLDEILRRHEVTP